MTASQITFYLVLFIMAIIYARKVLLKRAIVHYDAASVRAKLKARENIVLLDVRTAPERSRRQIPGSVHIPLHELRNRLRELDRVKDREIVCYCQSGSRSLSAAHTLKGHGFRVANLSGGMSAWPAA